MIIGHGGHDPGNVALRPGSILQLADLALECWRWIKLSRKVDRSTALFPKGFLKISVLIRDITAESYDAFLAAMPKVRPNTRQRFSLSTVRSK
jgi:hypothetical protein